MKRLIILIICIVVGVIGVIGCNNTEKVDVKELSMTVGLLIQSHFVEQNILFEVKDLTLIETGKNQYSGIMIATENGEPLTAKVKVLADGENITWEIQ